MTERTKTAPCACTCTTLQFLSSLHTQPESPSPNKRCRPKCSVPCLGEPMKTKGQKWHET